MEIYSSDGWKELFIEKEKIYVETRGRKKKIVEEDDDEIYDYLRNLRLAAKMHDSSMENLVIESKWRILDNIIGKADRDVLEKCPERIKRSRTDPEETRTEFREEVKEPEDLIIISSEEEEEEDDRHIYSSQKKIRYLNRNLEIKKY
jgi:hypothetical protein